MARVGRTGPRTVLLLLLATFVSAGSAFYSCDPPWLGHRSGITFRVDLPVATRRSDPPAVRREAALRAIAELPHPDVTIWSDGSARGGRNRAAQALIQFHHLNREETVRAPAGAVCSSLRAELTAMREAFAAVAGLEDGELASTNVTNLSKNELVQRVMTAISSLEPE
ncbi:hypothetical protein FJT64_009450 [Amphibalanus amphitrite]|uniref:Uncharacterized protein n=1 Tax=Amphibalanus amphitrite TaxID=1232801 RepID=A0A6A4VF70_AMPAM|nr:hypothetical protein FJT64_009450 [Amphibalanus amphitrite]